MNVKKVRWRFKWKINIKIIPLEEEFEHVAVWLSKGRSIVR
ncbi:hypothetical protein Patl1_10262 [Pistacia atlantica]|uniref:Uncharacterized protein n=1 Tax=Pistacia atlantica TaxID=434234 RepID=A0ACC1A1K5_9ROSI|nr:hypothetical protein Patl1_10262 [Pistacia atlantica]